MSRVSLFSSAVLAAFAALTLAACSSDSTSTTGGTTAHTGTAQKGQKCVVDNDCAAENSVCHDDNNLCTGALSGDCYMTECTANTTASCPGLNCAVLNGNPQNKSGICTLACKTDADCGPRGVCISASTSVCLTPCTSSSDCSNGFACVKDPQSGKNVCFVGTPI